MCVHVTAVRMSKSNLSKLKCVVRQLQVYCTRANTQLLFLHREMKNRIRHDDDRSSGKFPTHCWSSMTKTTQLHPLQTRKVLIKRINSKALSTRSTISSGEPLLCLTCT